MLKKLQIHNYAIIDELSLLFSEKLNIITGETGAGKSILMGALDLILGKRADSNILKSTEKKCIVEATFDVKNQTKLHNFLVDNDLDTDEEILIRREINVNGKSRSFVNDTPVTVSQLKELSSYLVDLHRQFDTQEIGNENFQRDVIDALADNEKLNAELKSTFTKYISSKKNLENLKEQQTNANKEADYNKFLLEEFIEINLQENELENLDAELKILSNAEQIKLQLSNIYIPLSESDEPITQQLKSLSQKINALKEYHTSIEPLQKRLLSAQIEIEDIAAELQEIDNKIIYDAERISVVSDRLSEGYKLQKKHSVNTTNALLNIQNSLAKKLEQILNINTSIAEYENETAILFEQANNIAKKVSANRVKQVAPFCKNVNALLTQIGMPNAQLKINIQPTTLSVNGLDEIIFLFDANKSNRFEPLQKVASGGELSRLMLSVKSLVAKKLQLPVLIFDEIDTGISGEAAKQVGIIMKSLSANHQLIAITHQPQIAAKADAHYFVYKKMIDDTIQSSVRLLDKDERINVIAQMLSGEKPTAAAVENAKEMMY